MVSNDDDKSTPPPAAVEDQPVAFVTLPSPDAVQAGMGGTYLTLLLGNQYHSDRGILGRVAIRRLVQWYVEK